MKGAQQQARDLKPELLEAKAQVRGARKATKTARAFLAEEKAGRAQAEKATKAARSKARRETANLERARDQLGQRLAFSELTIADLENCVFPLAYHIERAAQ